MYPWLLLFALTCSTYFLLWIPEDQPSAFSALVKCLPILCLVSLVRATASPDARTPLSAALLSSAVGDVCLIWPSAFLYGEWLPRGAGVTQVPLLPRLARGISE